MTGSRRLWLLLLITALAAGCDERDPAGDDAAITAKEASVLDSSVDAAAADSAAADSAVPDAIMPDLPPPTCTDGKKNGDETDVDCGGATCPACGKGKDCGKSADCLSGVCDPKTSTCQEPTCTDKVKNGDETDVDCGGATCPACATGLGCLKNGDCLAGICDAKTKTCAKATCTDKVKNGDETDVDCGGLTCPKCTAGLTCKNSGDCVSGVCDTKIGACAKASCTDKVKNGDETDVDCGGLLCPKCVTGKPCKTGGDCVSGVCDAKTNTCAKPTCTDKVKNGDETDVDCGGATCPACAAGKACKGSGDCASLICDTKTNACAKASCTDKVKNGGETHVDCGGPCPIPTTWYLDGDGDGYGGGAGQKACVSPGAKYVQKGGDCDDTDKQLVTACASLGDGRDGAVVISDGKTFNVNTDASTGRTSPDGVAWKVTGNISGVTVTLELAKGLGPGDLVLLADLQGKSQYVGNWEVLKVASISGASVTFTTKPTRTYGPVSSDLLVVQRIAQYKSLSITKGAYTASPWDGLAAGATKGRHTGIVAIKVQGALTLGQLGAITAHKIGYRGGSKGLGPEGSGGRVASGGATGGTGQWTLGGTGGGTPGVAQGGNGANTCSNKGGPGGLGGGGGGGKLTRCAGGNPPKGGGAGGGGASHDGLKNASTASLDKLLLGGGASAGAGGGASGANHNASVKTAPGGAPDVGGAGESGGGIALIWAAKVDMQTSSGGRVLVQGGSGGKGGSGESRNGYGSDDGGGGGGEGGHGASGGSVLLHCRELMLSKAHSIQGEGGNGGNGGNGGDGFAGGHGVGGNGGGFTGKPTSGTAGTYKGDGGAAGGGGAGGPAGGAGRVRVVYLTINGSAFGSAAANASLKLSIQVGVSSTAKWTP